MDVLDADDEPLRDARGAVAKRDIVQFVPFRQFRAAGPERLAMEVLAEVPGQVISFFKSKGIVPNPPPAAPPPATAPPAVSYAAGGGADALPAYAPAGGEAPPVYSAGGGGQAPPPYHGAPVVATVVASPAPAPSYHGGPPGY
jgi:hypothetical protein